MPSSSDQSARSILSKLPKFSSRNRPESSLSAQGNGRRQQLRYETLESRQLLAADVAEIVGTVTADIQGDGLADNDVVVAGASATLYRDNGDGLLGDADTVVQSGAQTDAAGRYRFEGVGAGRYFVEITPPADLQFAVGESVREVVVSDLEADFISGQTIDGFQSHQRVTASPPLPSNDPSRLADAQVMGGERDLYVELTDGDDPFSSVSIVTGAGLMRLASDTTVTGDAKIVWDGADDSASGVNATGLGGVDLTTHQGNRMTGIALTVGADHPDSRVTLRVYTDASNWTEYAATVPESAGGAATKYLVFGFADTASATSGDGADFSRVGAIELTFEGVSAVDGQVSLVGLIGHTVKEADFVAAPRLALGDHVFNDIDNNGRLDSGEAGIGGVKLNLYADSDGDNQYTSGVDELLGSTTTDADGRYLFDDLFAGKYVVQVAEENFLAGGALAGTASSSVNEAATDPDDDVDGDDNGIARAGLGVVSGAIMLSGGDEPAGDGDDDRDTNRTVDFGFYGFDLALDKSVAVGDGTRVTPEQELTYTVVVRNDGPSRAFDVQWTDVLPTDVSYQSAVASNGSVVQANGNRLSADLGNLDPGASVTMTVVVDVAAGATGVLVNESEVSAPLEQNLSNNYDQVSNPINPLVDVAIDKADSVDPVDAGETFSYRLTVTNRGPSLATGVTLVDRLPAPLTLVDASRPAASTVGNILRFDLGNLASGEQTEVEITVAVDEAFSGELLNHAEVSANEEETDYTNNEDEEPTTVRPKIDLQIAKTDSADPVRPGDTFTYVLEVRNNGPSDATGVTVVDVLPSDGISFQGTSLSPDEVDGREVTFALGELASGETRRIELRVAVDQSFVGVLHNTSEVSGNETETRYDNNADDEQTRVEALPAALGGNVYVDANDNGVFEPNETPIRGVTVTVTGFDILGNSVERTTTTDRDGAYLFEDLMPGTYNVVETHPTQYRDGKDSIGDNGDGITTLADGLVALDTNDADDRDADALGGIILAGGMRGTDYNFGELAGTIGPNKYDLSQPLAW